MKTGLIKITLPLMLLVISCGVHAQTSYGQPEKALTMSEFAAEKISSIRNNPAYYAGSVYEDQSVLFKNFPWMQDETGIVNKSIKPLDSEAGDAETAENNDYQCSLSSFKGSVSGTISFNNYMSKTDALSIFINNLFENEISPEYSKKRFILDCGFNLVQAEVESVENMESSGILNQYEITVSFASDTDLCNATALNILNFVRNNPWVSSDYILKYFPDSEYLFGKYIYFIALNILEPFFDKSFVKSNHDYEISADAFGYLSEQNSLPYIERVLAVFIKNELLQRNPTPLVFSNDIKTVDLGLKETSYNETNNLSIVNYFLSGSESWPELEKNSPVIPVYIQLSTDINFDDLFNPGEGAADKVVFIKDPATDNQIKYFADSTGRLQVWLEKNQTYILGYENFGNYFERTIETGENGKYIKIDL